MPYYPQLRLTLPPLLEILEWADRQQFDAIHVSTPGPMGLCGWLAAKMLRVPMLATYHTDFPAYVERLSGDHRISGGTVRYISWFYSQCAAVFLRSSAYRFKLLDLGVREDRLAMILPAIDRQQFSPRHRDVNIWAELGVQQPRRLLYAGRVSVEKNMPLLASAFKSLFTLRRDVALIVAGDGPYLQRMRDELSGLPIHFVGEQDDQRLARLYSSSDLLIFPSRTDTLGQVVMEAQACGLPAIVSADGGPKEIVSDGATGIVMSSNEPADWAAAIDALLRDESRRMRMALSASGRASRHDLASSFDRFWADHLAVVEPSLGGAEGVDPAITAQVFPPTASKDSAAL
jgi:glycosyltransferase involved in cell wall biosynthesis